jgi:DNA-binding PadR family transcriptional regulator
MGHGHAFRSPWAGFGFRSMTRGRRRHGPWGGPPWGFGPGGFGPPFGGRPRVRRGDVRAALLVLLDEEPRSGYALMQEIERRSDGVWSPSPGSVYPALQQLEDEGLVRTAEAAGRKAYELTDEGRTYVQEQRDELGIPWEGLADDPGDEIRELFQLIPAIAGALRQIAQSGDDAQIAQATEVLKEARRSLYRILSEDDQAT